MYVHFLPIFLSRLFRRQSGPVSLSCASAMDRRPAIENPANIRHALRCLADIVFFTLVQLGIIVYIRVVLQVSLVLQNATRLCNNDAKSFTSDHWQSTNMFPSAIVVLTREPMLGSTVPYRGEDTTECGQLSHWNAF